MYRRANEEADKYRKEVVSLKAKLSVLKDACMRAKKRHESLLK